MSNRRPARVQGPPERPTTQAVENRPFTFRLERVRAVRERIEDQAKEDLATSLSHRRQGEAMLRAASAELESAREKRVETLTGGVATGTDLMAAQAYLEHAQRAREARALELDRRETEVAARREALAAAARERQVLERLKERRREDHVREGERREGAVIDELALGVHRRAQGRAA
jgi:flagellar protein FliJ